MSATKKNGTRGRDERKQPAAKSPQSRHKAKGDVGLTDAELTSLDRAAAEASPGWGGLPEEERLSFLRERAEARLAKARARSAKATLSLLLNMRDELETTLLATYEQDQEDANNETRQILLEVAGYADQFDRELADAWEALKSARRFLDRHFSSIDHACVEKIAKWFHDPAKRTCEARHIASVLHVSPEQLDEALACYDNGFPNGPKNAALDAVAKLRGLSPSALKKRARHASPSLFRRIVESGFDDSLADAEFDAAVESGHELLHLGTKDPRGDYKRARLVRLAGVAPASHEPSTDEKLGAGLHRGLKKMPPGRVLAERDPTVSFLVATRSVHSSCCNGASTMVTPHDILRIAVEAEADPRTVR